MGTTISTSSSYDAYSQQLELCESQLGYRFRNRLLLVAALTHASGAQHRLASNERLEFLGDAILGAIVCEMLYHQFPEHLEGSLTKIKSAVVSRQTCARIARAMDLERCLILGKGMASARGVPRSLLADVFEALVAAVYLDGGHRPVRKLVEHWLQPEIDRAAAGELDDNYKSILQQLVQREYGDTPTYHVQNEKGPDHQKQFQVSACFVGREYPAAWGRNKKEAEQRAARNALAILAGEEPPYAGGGPYTTRE